MITGIVTVTATDCKKQITCTLQRIKS